MYVGRNNYIWTRSTPSDEPLMCYAHIKPLSHLKSAAKREIYVVNKSREG